MPKFLVPITRNTTETTMVDVIADTAAEARDLALVELRRSSHDFTWVTDDAWGGDPYFAGGDDLTVIEVLP